MPAALPALHVSGGYPAGDGGAACLRLPSSRARAGCGALQRRRSNATRHAQEWDRLGQAGTGSRNTHQLCGSGARIRECAAQGTLSLSQVALLKERATRSLRLRSSRNAPLGERTQPRGHSPGDAAPWCDRPGSWTQMLRRCNLSHLFTLSMKVVGMSLRSLLMRKLCCWHPNDLWGSDAKP